MEDRHTATLQEARAYLRERAKVEQLTDDIVIDVLRSMVVSLKTQREVAALFGVSPQYITDLINGNRVPGPVICEPLGIQPMRVYWIVE